MAAYAATVTADIPHAERISRNYGMLIGKCDITNYNTTGAEITDITRYFDDTTTSVRVICDGLSDNGYVVRWNTTDKCFHAYYPTAAQNATLTITDDDSAASNGVAVYFDEDGTATDRLLFVSPTNTDGTDSCVSVAAAAGGEVADDVDVGEVNFTAFGIIK